MHTLRKLLRALVITNMWPSEADPAFGAFVADQVAALRVLPDVQVDVFHFGPGGYLRAIRDLRRAHDGADYDVLHAHFGLTAIPAVALRGAPLAITLHGTDLRHPRSGRVTRALLPLTSLPATVSSALAQEVSGAGDTRQVAVLPCGVDLERFQAIPREHARRKLGLDPYEPCLLFPADPLRPGKRHDLAIEAADGARLLSLGGVEPEMVPLWINAANAIVLPSEAEGFGLAVLEALACDVPVVATPVGIHAVALAEIDGVHCAPYDVDAWRAALAPHLAAAEPRVAGRRRAALWSSERMARRVAAAWSELAPPRLYSAAAGPPEGQPLS
ncbi:D-inositol-3-phosphate glycosyltransferase [Paraconexibacter sp. AEG42_29]|uniref:D-inositol-3-phosphate glycosyltransferase n=1 Tax=Paraconexibacter sp. AEG42_29 TaxID=2997339 RepID=A0AAU7AY25_9ACTN